MSSVETNESESEPELGTKGDDHALSLGNDILVWWNSEESYYARVLAVTTEHQVKMRRSKDGTLQEQRELEYLIFYEDGDTEWLSRGDQKDLHHGPATENDEGVGASDSGRDGSVEEDSWKFIKIEVVQSQEKRCAPI